MVPSLRKTALPCGATHLVWLRSAVRVAKAAYAVDCRAAVVVANLFREGVWPEWRTVVEPELHPVTLRGRAFSSAADRGFRV
jgi:hypothetical protein